MVARIVRRPEVSKKTGLSRSTIYSLIAENKFPKQIKISLRSSGWLESEVDKWIESRIAERDSVKEMEL